MALQQGHEQPFVRSRGGEDCSWCSSFTRIKMPISLATAEDAALCFARSPEERVVAERTAAALLLTSEEALQQAQAEGLTLRKSVNKTHKTGYWGVNLNMSSRPKPYYAHVWRGGKKVHLGSFVSAAGAALCIARAPHAAPAAKPATAPPLTSEEAQQQAQAEGLTLFKSDSKAGYLGVYYQPGRPKPYQAHTSREGKKVHLGCFATAEEAALYHARSPEAQVVAAKLRAGPAALTSEEAQQQAQAEGLTLIKSGNKAGYFGVNVNKSCRHKHQAQARRERGGKKVHLGSFATAEEAALYVARLRAPPLAPVSKENGGRSLALPHMASDDGGGNDAGEEVEEEFEILDAVEVLDGWTD